MGPGEGASPVAQQDDGACPHRPPAKHAAQAQASRAVSTTGTTPFRTSEAGPASRTAAAETADMSKAATSVTAAAAGCDPCPWAPCACAPDGSSAAAIDRITAASQSAMGRADFIAAAA